MNYNVYSIFDRVTGLFSDPFVSINVGSAVRWFKHTCKNNLAAPDLVLYQLGVFDSSTGIMSKDASDGGSPKLIVNGVDVANE